MFIINKSFYNKFTNSNYRSVVIISIKDIPLPLSGLILAILSLGTILANYSTDLKYLCFFIGLVFLVLIFSKVIFRWDITRRDLSSPIILSSFGTFSMSLMLLSTYIVPFFGVYSICLWIIGLVIHLIIMFVFTYRFIICDFNLDNVYGTWWIVYVGISMAAISSPAFQIESIGHIFFQIGFILMIPSLILITYRYLKNSDIKDPYKPFKSIYTALMSILIVAYISTTNNPNLSFLYILYTLHIIFYIVSLGNLIKNWNIGFYPSFAAFSFPFVISAKATEYLLKVKANSIILILFNIELVLSITIVILITILYIKYLKNVIKNERTHNRGNRKNTS